MSAKRKKETRKSEKYRGWAGGRQPYNETGKLLKKTEFFRLNDWLDKNISRDCKARTKLEGRLITRSQIIREILTAHYEKMED